MNIDFHVHSKITSSFEFDPSYISAYAEECKILGVNSFVISEHCHAKNFDVAYNYIDTEYLKDNDCYKVNGINVFTGIEITTLEKFDVVVISDIYSIFELKRKIDEINSLERNDFIPIEALVNLLDSDKFIIILAHPYRRFDVFPKLNYKVFDKFDSVEINATDLFKFGIDEMKEKIKKLSVQLNKSITEGSDAHHPLQIGSVYSTIPGNYTYIKDIKHQIQNNNIQFAISTEFRTKITGARAIKKILCGKS